MESKSPARFTLGKQSSLARDQPPIRGEDGDGSLSIDPRVGLMYMANEGDLDGIKELLDSGTDVNFRDIDKRTALHVAACQGRTDVVQLLLTRGADVDPEDRWGSTPLADAVYYKHHDVIKLLEEHGAKRPIAPMHVQNAREVPEYEIDPKELDFSKSVEITKGTFRIALWRGIQVAVKTLGEEVFTDEDKVKAFRDELALLQKIRHPNVVQFLGAVTQSTPMIIVTEYLPKGDLRAYLKQKGALKPMLAVKFALDIARGMNYLHEHRPEAIIHRDLEPSNILRDDSGHLKVADFGVSKLLKFANTVREDRPVTCQEASWRYVAPEVYKNEEYDTKVDVFSFALILQEEPWMLTSAPNKLIWKFYIDAQIKLKLLMINLVYFLAPKGVVELVFKHHNKKLAKWVRALGKMIEGCPPFPTKPENEVPKAYIANERPPFRAPTKHYAYGLRELIEDCWSEEPFGRPTFRQILKSLDYVSDQLSLKRHWKVGPLRCFHCLAALWKKGHADPSSRSSRSTTR